MRGRELPRQVSLSLVALALPWALATNAPPATALALVLSLGLVGFSGSSLHRTLALIGGVQVASWLAATAGADVTHQLIGLTLAAGLCSIPSWSWTRNAARVLTASTTLLTALATLTLTQPLQGDGTGLILAALGLVWLRLQQPELTFLSLTTAGHVALVMLGAPFGAHAGWLAIAGTLGSRIWPTARSPLSAMALAALMLVPLGLERTTPVIGLTWLLLGLALRPRLGAQVVWAGLFASAVHVLPPQALGWVGPGMLALTTLSRDRLRSAEGAHQVVTWLALPLTLIGVAAGGQLASAPLQLATTAIALDPRRAPDLSLGFAWLASQWALALVPAEPMWVAMACTNLAAGFTRTDPLRPLLLSGGAALSTLAAMNGAPLGILPLALTSLVQLALLVHSPSRAALRSTLAWTGFTWVVARVASVVDADLAIDATLLLAIACTLDLLRAAWKDRTVRPADADALTVAALILSTAASGPGSLVWALAGTRAAVHFAVGKRPLDVVVAAVLLDVSLLRQLAEAGARDPLVWVGPVSLSALLVAQLLRGLAPERDRRQLQAVACGASFLTVFGQVAFAPAFGLRAVTVALVGVALGNLLRSRRVVELAALLLLSTLGSQLLRFGIEHAEQWALQLTVYGLLILGSMVLRTTHREQLEALWLRWRSRTQAWDSGAS